MATILQTIKGNLAFVLSKVVRQKIDGRGLGKKLDAELDAKLGGIPSEKIQRQVLRDILLDIIEGLCEEDPMELSHYLEKRVYHLRKEAKE